MIVNALSRSYDNIENRIVSPATIIDPLSRQELQTFGIWDTGATNSVITKKAVQLLSLPIREYTDVRGVGGLIPDVPVYYVQIRLNNQNITVAARVTECENEYHKPRRFLNIQLPGENRDDIPCPIIMPNRLCAGNSRA